jgi:hypothetical protein
MITCMVSSARDDKSDAVTRPPGWDDSLNVVICFITILLR